MKSDKVKEEKILHLIMDKLNNLELQIKEQQQMVQHTPKFYTSTEVKKMLKISDETIAKMRLEDVIEYVCISPYSFRYPANQKIFKQQKV